MRVLGPRGRGVSLGPVFSSVKDNTGVVTAKPPTSPALNLADRVWRPGRWRWYVGTTSLSTAGARAARTEGQSGLEWFTFTFLLHKIQDGDGPVRASQESRDALHHPFYLVLFLRSHPGGRSAAGPSARPPAPAEALRPQGAESRWVKNCPRSGPVTWLIATN